MALAVGDGLVGDGVVRAIRDPGTSRPLLGRVLAALPLVVGAAEVSLVVSRCFVEGSHGDSFGG